MQSKMTKEEMDRLIERCQNGEVEVTDLHPLLVYELELRANERLTEDGRPLMFAFDEEAYNGFVPEAHAVRVKDTDYSGLFSGMMVSVALALLVFLFFSGSDSLSLKNAESVIRLLVISLFTVGALLLSSKKAEDDLKER